MSEAARFLGSFHSGSSLSGSGAVGSSDLDPSPRRSGAGPWGFDTRLPPNATARRSRPPLPDEEGFEFGSSQRFRIGRTIGYGGSSTIREGWQLDGDGAADETPSVAVKIQYTGSPHGDAAGDLHIWNTLPRHPHVLPLLHRECVTVESTAMHPGTTHLTYLVMPLSTLGNLLTFVQREGQFNPPSRDRSPTMRPSNRPLHRHATLGSWAPPPRSPLSAGSYGEHPRAASLPTSPMSSSRRPNTSSGVSLQAARDIMRQLSSAVSFLHKDVGVVHCDIKLENVLAFQDPEDSTAICWKLADFGLAQRVQETTNIKAGSATGVGGTLEYAAPELVHMLLADTPLMDNAPSHRSGSPARVHPRLACARDMWALGCLLYSLVSGRLPFRNGVQSRLQTQILDGQFEMPERLLGPSGTAPSSQESSPASSVVLDGVNSAADDECSQIREVLTGLLEPDAGHRWDVDSLCRSRWLALH